MTSPYSQTSDSPPSADLSLLSRRSLLAASAYLTIAAMLSGCQSNTQNVLSIQALRTSIPRALIQAFRREFPEALPLDFNFAADRHDCFDLLQSWQRKATQAHATQAERSPDRWSFLRRNSRPSPPPALSQLGHYWLDRAVQLDTLAPLDRLAPNWQTLAARSPFPWSYRPESPDSPNRDRDSVADSAPSTLWGVPYRWSSTAIAYRRDKLRDWQPRDWSDLLDPRLRGRLVLPDSPRQVIGLALQSLGASCNSDRPDRVAELPAQLAVLGEQVLTYSSTDYQQALVLGDAWAAVGASQDIAQMPEYGRTVAAIVPASGTALWADLWVQPRASASAERDAQAAIAQHWVEFAWRPEIAATLALTTGAASPGIFGVERDQLPQPLRENTLVLPPEDVLAKSEFLRPLRSPDAVERYRQLWQTLRTA